MSWHLDKAIQDALTSVGPIAKTLCVADEIRKLDLFLGLLAAASRLQAAEIVGASNDNVASVLDGSGAMPKGYKE